MLPAAARMRSSAEFAATTRHSVRAATPALVLHARRPAPGLAGVRVGFVVSRGVGSAVVRNRVLRRLRHLVREHLDQLPAGTALVVRATPRTAGTPAPQLARDIDDALRRVLR